MIFKRKYNGVIWCLESTLCYSFNDFLVVENKIYYPLNSDNCITSHIKCTYCIYSHNTGVIQMDMKLEVLPAADLERDLCTHGVSMSYDWLFIRIPSIPAVQFNTATPWQQHLSVHLHRGTSRQLVTYNTQNQSQPVRTSIDLPYTKQQGLLRKQISMFTAVVTEFAVYWGPCMLFIHPISSYQLYISAVVLIILLWSWILVAVMELCSLQETSPVSRPFQ